jgi:methylmalonyl-CoA mutase N-terminal domain/subunit
VLGGTNSLHTNALDEVLALPSEQGGADRAAHPAGDRRGDRRANVADPLGGSWYVEALTDRIEAEAEAIFDRSREMGGDGTMMTGILRGIEDGWFIGEIADSAFPTRSPFEKGDKRVVGVNSYTDDFEPPLEIMRVSHEVETQQCATLASRRASRDQTKVDNALREVLRVARGDGNLVPPLLDAARAEATLGEICGLLVAEWGRYTEPPGI